MAPTRISPDRGSRAPAVDLLAGDGASVRTCGEHGPAVSGPAVPQGAAGPDFQAHDRPPTAAELADAIGLVRVLAFMLFAVSLLVLGVVWLLVQDGSP